MSLSIRGRVELGRFELRAELDAQPGEVVALVGPNGAGKTTLLQTVAGLRSVTEGSVRIGEVVVDDPARRRWLPPHRRPIGFVFQDLRLFPHLDVVDNVAYGLRRRGVDRAAARDRAQRWLERTGVAELARVRPATLSGGQAQRVALARALVVEPDVLLLDEPMSALDADARMAIRSELHRHLDAFTGVAVVIAHDVLDVVGLGSRVVVLDDGRVAQDTTPDELRAHPRTRHAAALVGVNLIHAEQSGPTITLPGGTTIEAPTADHHGPVDLVCPPRAVSVRPFDGTRPDGTWTSRITSIESVGDHARARLGLPLPISCRVPIETLEDEHVLDATVTVRLDPDELRVFPREAPTVEPASGEAAPP